ncbi:DUF2798 domain-containing protein [Psychrobacter sp. TB55-MNA-CIBAN-0194]|uniref:DUF2798 domain-containing protein n=1 Tax=Psychrobacter sp. TB55-MNA-CIBAN-0194 TaxID=3140445 RepID=UPI003316AB05
MIINPKYAGPLIGLIISLGMSFVMSFVMVSMNVGFTANFLNKWMHAWAAGFLIGFPASAVFVPIARKYVFIHIIRLGLLLSKCCTISRSTGFCMRLAG